MENCFWKQSRHVNKVKQVDNKDIEETDAKFEFTTVQNIVSWK